MRRLDALPVDDRDPTGGVIVWLFLAVVLAAVAAIAWVWGLIR